MSTEAQDLRASTRESSSSSGSGSDESSGFECNICFDLAIDPIVTLCGHLYCWPCLYKWLQLHSQSNGCPVCKATIQEEKLIPLYGRGKIPTDPRSKTVAGVEIPVRPAGQRLETAQPAGQRPETGRREASNVSNFVSGFGNFGNPTGFGGAFSPNFNFHLHGFSSAGGYGSTRGYHYGYSRPFRRAEGDLDRETHHGQEADGVLKRIHFVGLVLALIALFLL